MSFGAILLIALILISIGAMPTWAYSRNWGYVPSGSMGTVALVVLLMLALGKLWAAEASRAASSTRRSMRGSTVREHTAARACGRRHGTVPASAFGHRALLGPGRRPSRRGQHPTRDPALPLPPDAH